LLFISVSDARGRSPYPVSATQDAPAVRAKGSVHSAVKNRDNRERHYGFICSTYKHKLELDLRDT
jgi:hypothetical protein